MLNIITIFIIGISLSMDAFSLALIYGTQGIVKRDKIILSIIVGCYHFIMPIIGFIIGNYITKKVNFNINIIVGTIFILIAIEMILESFKKHDEKFLLNILGYILFGLSVSIDSLTTGIGLGAITNNYFLASSIFSLTSSLFTFLGLNIGNILNIKYGKISTIIGGSILFVLGLFYLIK